jgi:menaquinol-cytochrome c reductase iron-sulfur subunit
MDDVPPVETLETEGTTRRGFYETAIYGMMAVISAVLGIPALLYLFTPAKQKKADVWAQAGDVASLAPNSPVEMVFRRVRIDGWREVAEKGTAWVVKRDDNRIVAFGPNCTHLGCAYHWEAGQKDFYCPCHASVFSIDGNVMSGPAPRPLDRFETKMQGSKLLIGQLRKAGESQG